jgi:hypothetical protein
MLSTNHVVLVSKNVCTVNNLMYVKLVRWIHIYSMEIVFHFVVKIKDLFKKQKNAKLIMEIFLINLED